jgi:hypothetical protein
MDEMIVVVVPDEKAAYEARPSGKDRENPRVR